MGPLISENLLSEFKVELPHNILKQAQDFVRAMFKIRMSQAYRDLLLPGMTSQGLIDPGNYGIAMSYDFHINEEGDLKLIEINTNASFLALGNWLYAAHKMPQPVANFSIDEIRQNVVDELSAFGLTGHIPRISIMDEKPEDQRLYAEFLVYQQLFQGWGFDTRIQDLTDVDQNSNFIYNRYTDFGLTEAKSVKLRKLYLNKEACFSPNPYEYFLLADKQRMIDLRNLDFVTQLNLSDDDKSILWRHLPRAEELVPATAEKIWSERKGLFFKPKNSFGAKQSFKGASISRRAFDELPAKGFIAQEYVAAPERKFFTPEGEQSFKFDLRFYAYRDRVQSVVARLYQGQVTNLRTPFGGFAPVSLI